MPALGHKVIDRFSERPRRPLSHLAEHLERKWIEFLANSTDCVAAKVGLAWRDEHDLVHVRGRSSRLDPKGLSRFRLQRTEPQLRVLILIHNEVDGGIAQVTHAIKQDDGPLIVRGEGAFGQTLPVPVHCGAVLVLVSQLVSIRRRQGHRGAFLRERSGPCACPTTVVRVAAAAANTSTTATAPSKRIQRQTTTSSCCGPPNS